MATVYATGLTLNGNAKLNGSRLQLTDGWHLGESQCLVPQPG